MDFKVTLKILSGEFEKRRMNYALIGGFALGAYGVMRATLDLDFLAAESDLPQIDSFMQTLGYQRGYAGENVSQYVSELKILGGVDFLHAKRPLAMKILENAREISAFSDALRIKVARPEDLIGLKIQAMSNDPERIGRDFADVEALMRTLRGKLDWPAVKVYFDLFNMPSSYTEMLNKYGGQRNA